MPRTKSKSRRSTSRKSKKKSKSPANIKKTRSKSNSKSGSTTPSTTSGVKIIEENLRDIVKETSVQLKRTSERIRENVRMTEARIRENVRKTKDRVRKALPKKRADENFVFERTITPSIFRSLFTIRLFGGIVLFILYLYFVKERTEHTSFLGLESYFNVTDEYSVSPRWLPNSENWYFYFAFSFLLCGTYLGCFVTSPSFYSIRIMYTCVSCTFLIVRLYNYARSGYVLYMIDLCYINQYTMLYALWNWEHLPAETLGAIFAVANGPVAGSTFMLATGLELHHPEVFHSFWLHVCPMWISYAIRWRWAERRNKKIAFWRKRDIIWHAMTRVYLIWAFCYLIFLNLHPYLPVARDYETLFDWYVYGGAPEVRDDPPLVWVGKTVVYVGTHILMGLQGVCVATMCFKYERVHFLWICLVLFGTVHTGIVFYERSLDPAHAKTPNIIKEGLAKTALGWCVLLPTYLVCKYNANLASGLRRSPSKKKKRGRPKKKKT